MMPKARWKTYRKQKIPTNIEHHTHFPEEMADQWNLGRKKGEEWERNGVGRLSAENSQENKVYKSPTQDGV